MRTEPRRWQTGRSSRESSASSSPTSARSMVRRCVSSTRATNPDEPPVDADGRRDRDCRRRGDGPDRGLSAGHDRRGRRGRGRPCRLEGARGRCRRGRRRGGPGARKAADPGPIAAAIGPGASVCCYEVSDEVHERFADLGLDHRWGQNLDLKAIARAQLAERGRRADPHAPVVHDLLRRATCSSPTVAIMA